MDFFQTMSFYF